MKDTGDRDLRKLANDYYRGELSYASYRRARTQLLDRITEVTEVTEDADRTRPIAQQVKKSGIAGQSAAHKPERSWLLWGSMGLLVVALIVILLIVWVLKSESVTQLLDQSAPADTAVSGAAAEMAGKNSMEDDRNFNG